MNLQLNANHHSIESIILWICQELSSPLNVVTFSILNHRVSSLSTVGISLCWLIHMLDQTNLSLLQLGPLKIYFASPHLQQNTILVMEVDCSVQEKTHIFLLEFILCLYLLLQWGPSQIEPFKYNTLSLVLNHNHIIFQ